MKRKDARHVRDGIVYGRRFADALEEGRRAAALWILFVFLTGWLTDGEAQAFMRTVDARLNT